MSDPAKIEQFIELTGADAETAKAVLEASKGDMEAALAIHFGNDEDAPMPSAEEPPAEAPPALPTESTESSVDGILSNARQEGDGPAASTFQGQGRALGSRDEEAAPAAAESPPDAPEPPAVDRSNAKKVRVCSACPLLEALSALTALCSHRSLLDGHLSLLLTPLSATLAIAPHLTPRPLPFALSRFASFSGPTASRWRM